MPKRKKINLQEFILTSIYIYNHEKKILREHALALQMLLLINIFILILTILTQGLLAPSMQYSLEKRSNVFRVLLTFKDI